MSSAGRIFLVGFMCSGKTTVGKLLAGKLNWDFVDLDEEIEKREGLSIPEIFELKGENYFRELEYEVLKDVATREKIVVSTGGGLGANPKAMNLMKEKGTVLWLKVPFEEFLRRCGKDKSRPLLKKGRNYLLKLMTDREKVYSKAHLTLEPGEPERMVEIVLARLFNPREGLS